MTTLSSASSATTTVYDSLITLVREASLLGSSASVLGWDQETMMPPGGVEHRASQLAQLARIHHELATDPRIDELLLACEEDADLMADPDGDAAANVREIRRQYDRETKLPSKLVEELARTSSVSQHEWAKARQASDFKRFQPWLEKVVGLLREKAACLARPEHGEPWDALADGYEPGMTGAQIEALFTPLRKRLTDLLNDLMENGRAPSNKLNELKLPIAQQEAFCRFIASSIGFDFERGRMDRSTHPFCSGSHCGDVRITTRFRDDEVNDALGSTLHECGHAIYEQGLLPEHIGTPLGSAVSLGIHESQSRMWENQVGRSRAFWDWCGPKLTDYFGDAVAGMSPDDIYGGANIVRPDFIRVEADESTYNLHIMIRFEIERAVLKGELEPAGIPEVWNRKYKEYLNLDVPDDRRGCLQDIHWSMAAMGYFPTYTLGNLYCAQFFEAALKEMPDLHEQFARGEFNNLKSWLNEKIHRHGSRYLPERLCEVVTGQPLSPDPLMRHLEGKLRPIYGLA